MASTSSCTSCYVEFDSFAVSCVLMVSELILKLVHTSVDPVAAASCVLCKLQRDGKSFLVSEKLER